jgi:hypothetical protein
MKPLTKREAKAVILRFWDLNASRAPIKAFEDIVDCENFEIILAGTVIAFKGIAGLADHQMGKLIFFNQRFELKSIHTRIADDGRAISKTEGVWYAAYWQSPAATSHELIADLKHTWTVVRSEKSGKPVLLRHVCDKLTYRRSHGPIEAPKDFHLTIGRRTK